MDCHEQLKRIQANKTSKKRVQSLASLMIGMAGAIESADDIDRLTLIAKKLAECTDESFAQACRIAGFAKGVLVIHARDAATVALMRRRWLGILMKELPVRYRELGIGSIVFRQGLDGFPVSDCERGEDGC